MKNRILTSSVLVTSLLLAAVCAVSFGAKGVPIDALWMGIRDPATDQPLASGTVTTYDASTGALKSTYMNVGCTLVAPNPIPLDYFGRATTSLGALTMIYGNGNYKLVIKDSSGTTRYQVLNKELTSSSEFTSATLATLDVSGATIASLSVTDVAAISSATIDASLITNSTIINATMSTINVDGPFSATSLRLRELRAYTEDGSETVTIGDSISQPAEFGASFLGTMTTNLFANTGAATFSGRVDVATGVISAYTVASSTSPGGILANKTYVDSAFEDRRLGAFSDAVVFGTASMANARIATLTVDNHLLVNGPANMPTTVFITWLQLGDHLDMFAAGGPYKIQNLATPTVGMDAVNKAYVDVLDASQTVAVASSVAYTTAGLASMDAALTQTAVEVRDYTDAVVASSVAPATGAYRTLLPFDTTSGVSTAYTSVLSSGTPVFLASYTITNTSAATWSALVSAGVDILYTPVIASITTSDELRTDLVLRVSNGYRLDTDATLFDFSQNVATATFYQYENCTAVMMGSLDSTLGLKIPPGGATVIGAYAVGYSGMYTRGAYFKGFRGTIFK